MSGRLRERHDSLLRDEVCVQPVKRSGSFRVALCYPNLYFVGMSNLGFQSVYQMLNARHDVLCERAFLPDDVDRQELERSGRPLTALESGADLRSFHVLAFSVSFENDYVHVLRMLRLAGIPLRAADRGPDDPLVIMGGSALFLNPEPSGIGRPSHTTRMPSAFSSRVTPAMRRWYSAIHDGLPNGPTCAPPM